MLESIVACHLNCGILKNFHFVLSCQLSQEQLLHAMLQGWNRQLLAWLGGAVEGVHNTKLHRSGNSSSVSLIEIDSSTHLGKAEWLEAFIIYNENSGIMPQSCSAQINCLLFTLCAIVLQGVQKNRETLASDMKNQRNTTTNTFSTPLHSH